MGSTGGLVGTILRLVKNNASNVSIQLGVDTAPNTDGLGKCPSVRSMRITTNVSPSMSFTTGGRSACTTECPPPSRTLDYQAVLWILAHRAAGAGGSLTLILSVLYFDMLAVIQPYGRGGTSSRQSRARPCLAVTSLRLSPDKPTVNVRFVLVLSPYELL